MPILDNAKAKLPVSVSTLANLCQLAEPVTHQVFTAPIKLNGFHSNKAGRGHERAPRLTPRPAGGRGGA